MEGAGFDVESSYGVEAGDEGIIGVEDHFATDGDLESFLAFEVFDLDFHFFFPSLKSWMASIRRTGLDQLKHSVPSFSFLK